MSPRSIVLAAIVFILSQAAFGCFSRTVIVPPGKPFKLGQEVKGVKVWVKDASGQFVAGTADLKEGWVVVPSQP